VFRKMQKSEEECIIDDKPKSLIVLREITRELAAFSDFSTPRLNVNEIDMDAGTSFMVGLYKHHHIAVARQFASAGAVFPFHAHDQWELLLVYEGSMDLIVGDKKDRRTLRVKDFYYLEPGTPHYAEFNEDCWFLAITIPAAEAWPEGS